MRAIPERRLDKKIIGVWRLSALISMLLVALCLFIPLIIVWLALSSELSGAELQQASAVITVLAIVFAAVSIALIIVFVVVYPSIRYARWRFEVFEEEIDIYKGIVWRKRTIIPLIRVQNVDTRQGPILRANGLAAFTVSTAAGGHDIPGLAVAEADELRDRVAILARIAQEDV
jgi:membrane protein YdbS with pleckstrin-like domain